MGIALVPLTFLFFRWKEAPRVVWWLLFCFFVVTLLGEWWTGVLARNWVNNYFLIHILTIINMSLLVPLMLYMLKSTKIRNLTLFGFFIILGVSLFEFVYNQGYLKPNTVTYSLYSLIMIMLSIAFFFQLLSDFKIKSLLNYYPLWINSAVLLFFGTSFFVMLLRSSFYMNRDISNAVWPILLISNIVFHLLLTVAIWVMKRT